MKQRDFVWCIRYYDNTMNAVLEAGFIAHCQHCAWRRFETQNKGCRILSLTLKDSE